MRTYTYSEARQNLAELLDRARQEGRVRIRRRDGQVFLLIPVTKSASPFDIEGVDLDLSMDEIANAVRESRTREG
jgi:antitoxin Phd